MMRDMVIMIMMMINRMRMKMMLLFPQRGKAFFVLALKSKEPLKLTYYITFLARYLLVEWYFISTNKESSKETP